MVITARSDFNTVVYKNLVLSGSKLQAMAISSINTYIAMKEKVVIVDNSSGRYVGRSFRMIL